ncbi:thioredoxin family protein [Streptomyces phage LukeCage]|uniref:Thioredoxin n=2 Tax=Karimacvirus TaxID=2843400 RepID=A0A345M8Z2_9CAUD|nr:thioredoxin family protein [Streptomyces phage StarPlatinum]YP_009840138.1 thioredoxin family protein [Streptomyces phage LukeCage]AXH66963.1 thioredoxin [Streptomyces phage StarPlatinum]AXH69737.1 thioredoxin [Streptomyces phage LukeCage]
MNVASPSALEEQVKERALVVFSAPAWCAPCRALAPHVIALSEEVDYPIVYVDIDEAEAIRVMYDVMSVPRIYEFVNGEPTRELKGRTILALRTELAAE